MTKSKKLVEKYFPYEYEIVDTPYFGYEIHIGKRSCGWKPLFQEHKNAYDSVEGMKESSRNIRKVFVFLMSIVENLHLNN